MANIVLRNATLSDVPWINQQYESIKFKPSNLENEQVVLAEVNGALAGIGRLVTIEPGIAELGGIFVLPVFRKLGVAEKIVGELVSRKAHFKTLYCLPFSHLEHFYLRFGFRRLTDIEMKQAPDEIRKKLCWCQSTYQDSTSVLIM